MRIIIKRAVSFLLAAVFVQSVYVTTFAADEGYITATFSDVPENTWAYTYVEQAAEKGWVSGVGDGKFDPDGQVTYAQLVTMLDQAFFKDEVDNYTGAASPWYVRFCTIADQKGLFNDTNAQDHATDESRVGAPMNRYEMAQSQNARLLLPWNAPAVCKV